MLLPTEGIGYVPVFRPGLARSTGAALDVLRCHLLPATAIASDVVAYDSPRNSTTSRRDILSTPTANLVSEDAANHGTYNRPRNTVVTALLNDLLLRS